MKNVAASVRARLLNRAKTVGEDFNYTLLGYGKERLLYRLGASDYADRFVLKGAALFLLWNMELRHRPTKDLDLLSFGSPDFGRLGAIFGELCGVEVEDDGLQFDPDTIVTERIKEDEEYEGVRVKLQASLGKIPIRLSIDVGFGDAITPDAVEVSYPTLLEGKRAPPAPRVRAYPRETVVAEKIQAMTHLGMVNTRLKDFFDVVFLARHFDFSGGELALAVRRTFERRRTALPPQPPVALTATFGQDADKQRQWKAFLKKNGLEEVDLEEIVNGIHAFLWPVLQAAQGDDQWDHVWSSGGPWVASGGD